MKKVAVLMSTYNGEKYLEEQLKSILNQSYPKVKIYIRDDGSTDGTINILKKYAQNNSNIRVELGENVGYPKCFYKLTNKLFDEDYFMFSDQDDQWLPDKIERAVRFLSNEEYSGALCYYSSYNICDKNLKFIRKSMDRKSDFTLENTIYEVCGLEFTMAMNKSAMELLKKNQPKKSKARGTWMSMLFASQGKILYDNFATANYRRHESTVTSNNMGKFGMLLWRAKTFLLSDSSLKYKELLDEFQAITENQLTIKEKRLLAIFCDRSFFGGALKKTFYPHRLRSNFLDEIQLRTLFLLKRL
ncbi:glycosyltransferase [Enterococcus nangangensis]|uniref:glycosyltransferase n=1 Tax=Enterococcus nangangensis TaxID=2559926 RepID=UPI0010F5A402|nr:glycosyltransferase [Enterococcus nangangensis]